MTIDCERLRLLLHEGIEAVPDRSAPSVSKFDRVRGVLASHLRLQIADVGAYYISKAGNFVVRLQQPGVMGGSRKKLVLAILRMHGRSIPAPGWLSASRVATDTSIRSRCVARLVPTASGTYSGSSALRIRPQTNWLGASM